MVVQPNNSRTKRHLWTYMYGVIESNPASPEEAYEMLFEQFVERARLIPKRPSYFKRITWATENKDGLIEMFRNMMSDKDYYKEER